MWTMFLLGFMVALLISLFLDTFRKNGRLEDAIQDVQKDWSCLATGDSGNVGLEKAWLAGVQRMYILFCKKNHDYGANNLAMGGVKGIVLRLGDKISRLWQLAGLAENKSAKVSNESVEDNLLDVANYGLVGYLIASGKWPKATIFEEFDLAVIMTIALEKASKEEISEADERVINALLEKGDTL